LALQFGSTCSGRIDLALVAEFLSVHTASTAGFAFISALIATHFELTVGRLFFVLFFWRCGNKLRKIAFDSRFTFTFTFSHIRKEVKSARRFLLVRRTGPFFTRCRLSCFCLQIAPLIPHMRRQLDHAATHTHTHTTHCVESTLSFRSRQVRSCRERRNSKSFLICTQVPGP